MKTSIKSTTKEQITKDILALKNGQLYEIRVAKTSVPKMVGISYNGQIMMGSYISSENLIYENCSQDRKYASKKAVIEKLKSWNIL
jgi:hypothetical protein